MLLLVVIFVSIFPNVHLCLYIDIFAVLFLTAVSI